MMGRQTVAFEKMKKHRTFLEGFVILQRNSYHIKKYFTVLVFQNAETVIILAL